MSSFEKLVPPALMALATVATSSWTHTASACGGLFCSASSPVNQVAERILFAQDGETTTQIVEILYDGPAERFAWVLPVPGEPEIAVSSSVVFQRLQQATNPIYQLTTSMTGDCSGALALARGSSDASSGASFLGGPSVTVVDQGSVGPFDYQTIAVDAADADPASVAIRWLEANDYDVGELGPDVLRPYLEDGLNLLAVRLQKGLPTGAIRPLSLTFQSSQPSIPIRPTAVAANDDMGVLVWVLGASRTVPVNYKGLELNELMINWLNPGSTYDQVVSAAADEAGGQGFVTELAQQAANLHDAIDPRSTALDPDRYTNLTVADAVIELTGNYGLYDGFDKVLAENVVLRDGVSPEAFLECPYCYERGAGNDSAGDPIGETNVPAFLDAIQSQVLDPISDAADLFLHHAYVTRLYTTMSAEDMDVDPLFDFNPDLDDVSNVHTAERVVTCDGTAGPWKVVLEGGRSIYGEGNVWPLGTDTTPRVPLNARVVEFKTTGAPSVEVDNTSVIASEFSTLPASRRNGVDGGVFSCALAPGRRGIGVLGLGAGFVVLVLGRRRPRTKAKS